MTDGLLLDTHIVLWLDSGSPRLRDATRHKIEAHWRQGGSILLSAVSVWEIALLADAGRITLDVPAEAWVTRFLNRPGLEGIPLSTGAAARAYQLDGLAHRDPADRMLIATAMELSCPLVTYDERIASFAAAYGRQHGFSVVT